MPTEEDLLDAIDANPDDDAPRLAHAGWLEANGDPERAAFIRLQLAGKGDPARWTEGLPAVRGMTWRCRRGYPEVVQFDSLKAFKDGWPLTAGLRVRHVRFSGLRGAKLADEPALTSLSSLEFSEVDSAVLLAVLRSPRLGPLRHLDFRALPPDPGLLAALAALPGLAGLRSLDVHHFSYQTLPEGPVAALRSSPHLTGLRWLRLRCWSGEEGMRALWRGSSLAGLTSLELVQPGIYSSASRQAGLDDLGDGAALPALERFVFARERHEGGDPALAVGRAACWAKLRVLEGLEPRPVSALGVPPEQIPVGGRRPTRGVHRLDDPNQFGRAYRHDPPPDPHHPSARVMSAARPAASPRGVIAPEW